MKGVNIILEEAEGVLTSNCKGAKRKKDNLLLFLKVQIHFVLMERPVFTYCLFLRALGRKE